jgi:hypothetical protein
MVDYARQTAAPYRYFYGPMASGTTSWDSPGDFDVVLTAISVSNTSTGGAAAFELGDADGNVFLLVDLPARVYTGSQPWVWNGDASLGQLTGLTLTCSSADLVVMVAGYLVAPQTYAVLPS